jgi:hypothetical protein
LYRLKLLKGSRIHDVFALDVLTKDPNTPLPGQETLKPRGEVIASQEEYVVKEVLAIKLNRGTLEYRIS